MNLNNLVCCFGLVKNSGSSASREALCQCVLEVQYAISFSWRSTHTLPLGKGPEPSKQGAASLLAGLRISCPQSRSTHCWTTLTWSQYFYLNGQLNHGCASSVQLEKSAKPNSLEEVYFYLELWHFWPLSNRMCMYWLCYFSNSFSLYSNSNKAGSALQEAPVWAALKGSLVSLPKRTAALWSRQPSVHVYVRVWVCLCV